MFDLDLGFRFRFHETKTGAAGLILGSGIGAGTIWVNAPGVANVPFFHLPARIGPFFDSGAFTLEILLGAAALFNKSALGAFESSIELGARF